ncbi:uncharacterized protein LOC101855999 [Aplysia californica]|uniref:Uncharacterized protein LOC101855999 n=1 Tax=Aplysia californica TaxID=6500 RepID=A0ABM0JDZ0_APLCA|nr:uncharacterized protein LOC101855999 [Aplysia californica]
MEALPQCPPINTARLKPFRQRLNKTIMTITDSGHVSMELVGQLSGQCDGPEGVKELFHVSPDGLQIEIYQNPEGVASLDGCPMPNQAHKVYSYPNVSSKHWKKYLHAYKFVDVVKSRTSKVSLVTERARCKLMENSPQADFQANFIDGVNIVLSKSSVIITDKDGSSLTLDADALNSRVCDATREMIDYAKQCQAQCVEIEKSVGVLHSRDSSKEYFPITIGTNSAPFHITTQVAGKELSEPSTSDNTHYSREKSYSVLAPDHHTVQQQNFQHHVPASPSSDGPCHGEDPASVYQSPNNASEFSYTPDPLYLGVDNHNVPEWFCGTHPNEGFEPSGGNTHEVPAQFSEFVDSSCSPSVASHSATNTPQKLNYSTAVLSSDRHDVSAGSGLPSSLMLASGLPLSDMYTAQQMPYNGPISHPDSNRNHFGTFNESIGCGNSCDLFEQPSTVPFTPVCQSIPPVTLSDYSTPKKTQHPHKHLLGYSVDSNKKHYARQQEQLAFSVQALVTPEKVKSVRKNLFPDTLLTQPLRSPVPTTSVHTLDPDLIACRPTPSLELSDCSDGDEFDVNAAQTGATASNDNPPNLFSAHDENSPSLPFSSVRQGSEVMASSDSLSKCFSRNSAYAVQHFQPMEQKIDSLEQVMPGQSNLPESMNESMGSLVSLSNAVAMGHSMQTQKLVSCDIQEVENSLRKCQTPLPCSSPKKRMPVRKVACSSPSKLSSLAEDMSTCSLESLSSSENRDSLISPEQTHHTTAENSCMASPLRLKESRSREFSLTPKIEKISSRPRDNPNHSSSDSGFQSQRKPAVPMSPQKEFVMPSMADRSGLDLYLPTQVRNSLDMSVSSYYSDSPSSTPSSGCDPIRQVFVPYTGWASFYATGAVWILYNDGTQLGVKSTEAAMIYIDQDGSQSKFKNGDPVPEIVKLKLEKLPTVIDLLMKSPAAGST